MTQQQVKVCLSSGLKTVLKTTSLSKTQSDFVRELVSCERQTDVLMFRHSPADLRTDPTV